MRTLEEYTNHYSEIFVNDKENYLEMRDINVLFPNGKYFKGQLEDLYKDENYIKYKDFKLVSSLIPADLVICAIDASLSLRELIDNSLEYKGETEYFGNVFEILAESIIESLDLELENRKEDSEND